MRAAAAAVLLVALDPHTAAHAATRPAPAHAAARPTATPLGDAPSIEDVRRAAREASVVLLVLDAARASAFPWHGHPCDTAPNLSRLAEESIVFESAYTPACYTIAALATLHTGREPLSHGLVAADRRLDPAERTLAERLSDAGLRTIGLAATENGGSGYGFEQGFGSWFEPFRFPPPNDRPAPFEPNLGWISNAAWFPDLLRAALDETGAFPRGSAAPGGRVFVYAHVREPHAPYEVPPEMLARFTDASYEGLLQQGRVAEFSSVHERSRILEARDLEYARGLYDANLRVADEAAGAILDDLRARGILDRSVVVVTADHGEAFWEHGLWGHSRQVYEEAIHVPLLVRLPVACGVAPGRVEGFASLADVVPTIDDLLGTGGRGARVDGRSLLPAILTGRTERDAVFAETLASDGSEPTRCVRTRRWKLVRAGDGVETLFDLDEDPCETVDRASAEVAVASELRARLLEREAARDESGASEVAGERAPLSQEEIDHLRALGYVGGDSPPEAPTTADRILPSEETVPGERAPQDLVESAWERYRRFLDSTNPCSFTLREASVAWNERLLAELPGALAGVWRDGANASRRYRFARAGRRRWQEIHVLAGESDWRSTRIEAFDGTWTRLWTEGDSEPTILTGLRIEPLAAAQLLFDVQTVPLTALGAGRVEAVSDPARGGGAIRVRVRSTWLPILRSIDFWFEPELPFPRRIAAADEDGIVFDRIEVLETQRVAGGVPFPSRLERRWSFAQARREGATTGEAERASAGETDDPVADAPDLRIEYRLEDVRLGADVDPALLRSIGVDLGDGERGRSGRSLGSE